MVTNGIEGDHYKEFFAPPSLVPVAGKCNFKVLQLESRVVIDLSHRAATWTKHYRLKKVKYAHSGNDHWFEVTGCPSGECYSATSGTTGFRYESIRDSRRNLVYRIDFGRQLGLQDELEFTLQFITSSMESENKLIDIASDGSFFKSVLFRYDQCYPVHCDVLELNIEVMGGRISGAWPNAICTVRNKTKVQFRKLDIRPYEVVTPLVHIEKGSRWKARIAQGIVTFLLGVGASYLAGRL